MQDAIISRFGSTVFLGACAVMALLFLALPVADALSWLLTGDAFGVAKLLEHHGGLVVVAALLAGLHVVEMVRD